MKHRHLMVCEKLQHSSSFVVHIYIFFYPTATKEKGKQEKKDTIDAQYFVTNLHKITCMLQLFFACLPTECAYNHLH